MIFLPLIYDLDILDHLLSAGQMLVGLYIGLLLFLVFTFVILLIVLSLLVRYDEWRERRRNRHH